MSKSGRWLAERRPWLSCQVIWSDQTASASSSRGPTNSRCRAVIQAAVHASAQWWLHHVGPGGLAGTTSTPATLTPVRVATKSDPAPRVIGTRTNQRSRSSRRAWLLAATSLQPIAQRHASRGAGPTLANQASPLSDPGPGRSCRLISPLAQLAPSNSPSSPARPHPWSSTAAEVHMTTRHRFSSLYVGAGSLVH